MNNEDMFIKVMEIIRVTKRTNERTLRLELAAAVREAFGYDLYRCCTCGAYKSASDFHSDKNRHHIWGPSGRRHICWGCDKIARQDRYWSNPQKYRDAKNRSQRAKRSGKN